jgi:hypothetical protein
MKNTKLQMALRLGVLAVGLSMTPEQPASAAPRPLSGRAEMSYEVPKSEYLETAYVVELDRARLRFSQNSAVLDYALPMELDGTTPKRFRLQGHFDGQQWNLSTNDSANSAGEPSAKATCTGDQRQFTCVMNYAKNNEGLFPIDMDSADAYLRTRSDLTPDQIGTIKTAQLALSHEPIGIIRVNRRR